MLLYSSSYLSRKGIHLVSRNSYSKDRRTKALYIIIENDWMANIPLVIFRLYIHRELAGPEVKTGLSACALRRALFLCAIYKKRTK
jgi:hypothetical protein